MDFIVCPCQGIHQLGRQAAPPVGGRIRGRLEFQRGGAGRSGGGSGGGGCGGSGLLLLLLLLLLFDVPWEDSVDDDKEFIFLIDFFFFSRM